MLDSVFTQSFNSDQVARSANLGVPNNLIHVDVCLTFNNNIGHMAYLEIVVPVN